MKRVELLKWINQAANERWIELDLSNQGLTELPAEIGNLTALKELNLGYDWNRPGERNQLTFLPPEIGRLTALHSLDLKHNSLTTLPREIGCLTNLYSLNLQINHLLALPTEISQLTVLHSLDLSGNRLATFPLEVSRLLSLRSLDLSYNKMTDLPPAIGSLTILQSLNLRSNHLTSLSPEIGYLIALQFLELSFNQLETLPVEIGQLKALQSLNLRENQLATLPVEIGQLINLRSLDLRKNKLITLPTEIARLTSLQSLSVSENQLTTLPPEIKQLTALQFLDFSRNSSLQLPFELMEKNRTPQSIIRIHLDYSDGEKRPLNEVKLVFVGEGGVGKTSLIDRLLNNAFDPRCGKTAGIAIRHWQLGLPSPVSGEIARNIRVNIWDFGGQEIMHATHRFFLTKRTLYVLVLDNRYSEAENRLDYWLTLIRSFGGDSPIIIVGNKADQHALDLGQYSLKVKHLTIQAIVETSCATGAGIAALREAIIGQISRMSLVADLLPNTWFDVKIDLERMDVDYIPHSTYVRLCCEKNVTHPESQNILLEFLHDLGVVLHFPDPCLETTNILNPEWVTQGVYRILNTQLPFEEQGILTWDMLVRILDDEAYTEKRMFIVDMMQKFELCYELTDQRYTYLIPDLLPKEILDIYSWDGTPCFEIHYPVLPSSILTRLIVRMHRHIKERLVWRTGMLLACEGTEALVIADLVTNRITIAMRGSSSVRRELLARIREHLEIIHSSFADLQPIEKVPIPGHPEIPPVAYRWLRDMEHEGVQTFPPPGLTEFISVRQLLDGVEPPETRQERDGRSGDTYYISNSQIGIAGREGDVSDGVHFGHQTGRELPKP